MADTVLVVSPCYIQVTAEEPTLVLGEPNVPLDHRTKVRPNPDDNVTPPAIQVRPVQG